MLKQRASILDGIQKQKEQEETEDEQLETIDPVFFERVNLYPKQAAMVDDPARFTITEASTKAGKTMSHIEWQLEQMQENAGGNHWWVAQTKEVAAIAFARAQLRLKGFINSGENLLVKVGEPIPFLKNETKQWIKVFGCTWWFKSGDNPDSLFGEDVYTLVGDEITRWKAKSWTACYTTLTATSGKAKLIGNVQGKRNFAYKLARKAETRKDPDWSYHKLIAQDAVDAGVLKQTTIDQAKKDLSAADFRELYMAEASEADLNVLAQPKYYTELPTRGIEVVYGNDGAYSKQTWADDNVLIRAIKIKDTYTYEDGKTKKLPYFFVTNIWRKKATADEWYPFVRKIAGARNPVYFRGSGTEKGAASLAKSIVGINLKFKSTNKDKLTNSTGLQLAINQERFLLPDPEVFPEALSWLPEFEEELANFTGLDDDENDDRVDAAGNMVDGGSARTDINELKKKMGVKR